jgi:hypothetical protein
MLFVLTLLVVMDHPTSRIRETYSCLHVYARPLSSRGRDPLVLAGEIEQLVHSQPGHRDLNTAQQVPTLPDRMIKEWYIAGWSLPKNYRIGWRNPANYCQCNFLTTGFIAVNDKKP